MHIVHVTHLYLPSIGGTEIHTRELSIALAKMGHGVSIFTTDGMHLEDLFPKIGYKTRHLDDAIFKDSNVIVERFHVYNSLLIALSVKCLRSAGINLRYLRMLKQGGLDYIEALRNAPFTPRLYLRLLESVDIDAVNATPFPFGYSLLLKKLCKKKRFPFVVTPRAHIFSDVFSQSFLLKTAREADAVIALTEGEKSFFMKQNVHKDKIFVTGIGVHPKDYQKKTATSFRADHNIPDNCKIVLFLGRLVSTKGIDLLIESMRIVWNEIPDVYLVLLGRSEPYTPRIDDMIHNETRAKILLDVPEDIKIDALLSSDMLVLPSIHESFGGVFLEAWAAEKPVIGIETPITKCIVDDMVNGLLSKSLSKYELAEKIIYLLENKQEAKRMGKRGREKVLKNYAWEIIAKKTLETYEHVSKK